MNEILAIIDTFMPLIVIVIIVFIVLFTIKTIKDKVSYKLRALSRTLFGTNSIIDGIEKQNLQFDNTPKSISSIDRLVMPKIKEDFPDMEIEELKARNKDKIYALFNGINNKDLSEFDENSNVSNQVVSLANDIDIKHATLSDVKVHKQGIINYTKTKENASIIMQSSFEYILELDNQKRKYQKKIETQWIYLLDESNFDSNHIFKKNCPNCGAAITNLGDKKCSYCGSDVIIDYTKTWYFNSVKIV